MQESKNRALSRRSIEIRAKWQQRISAQQTSGVKQSVWCRQRGIQPKYFSLWKSKLGADVRAGTEIADDKADIKQRVSVLTLQIADLKQLIAAQQKEIAEMNTAHSR